MITQENTRYFKILFRKKYKNMIVNAVVCELNPMHLGHKFIFDSAKATSEDDSVNVAIMSGNFTQRCTPAVFDKYTRAEAAVRCGADIVIELPFPWCSSGVEDFALGGVTVAAALGATRLVFGSERGNIDVLSRVADIKDSEDYKTAVIEAEENSRESGSAVIFDSVMESFGIAEKLGANDKLGAEYIRFGRKLGIKEFYPIKRISDAKSATELRGIMFSGGIESLENQIPRDAFSVFTTAEMCREERYRDILFTHCRLNGSTAAGDILAYAAKVAREAGTAEEFFTTLPTKKYTAARLRREILHHIIGDGESAVAPRFTVLLAMNERGREYISANKKTLGLPIITKPSDTSGLDEVGQRQYEIHRRADELYALCLSKPAAEYLKKHPRIL